MSNVWNATAQICDLGRKVKEQFHHPRLALASIWWLLCDSKPIQSDRFVAVKIQRCNKAEKLETGHDFKVMVIAEAWEMLTNDQREQALDEAMCRCGVKYIPQMIEISGRKEPIKDDLGRIVYTDQIAYDNEGNPKWKIEQPDAGLFYAMLLRRGQYSEEAHNVLLALNGKPLLQPIAAVRADAVDEVE